MEETSLRIANFAFSTRIEYKNRVSPKDKWILLSDRCNFQLLARLASFVVRIFSIELHLSEAQSS